jgi:SpoVK/Ycf46/Vps4 family AAA+-type ATPase
LAKLNPTGLKDLLAEVPSVKWEDIGGYDEIKDEIKRVIEWPLRYP